MFVLLLVALLGAVAVGVLPGAVRQVQQEHALAGRFGEASREDLISRWCRVAVATAERYERLCHFEDQLRARAWTGTPLRIEPGRGPWCEWRFADGQVWRVRHGQRVPRTTPRLIVGSTGEGHDGAVAVRTYVPGSAELVLPVTDALLLVA